MDEFDMTLEQFVHEFPLPQFAKVTQGYDDPWNPDNEFSTNDFIKIHDSVCPRVDIRFLRSPDSEETVRVTVSTRNTARFRLSVPAKPRVFACVRQIVQSWPLTVKARRDHNPPLIVENGVVTRSPPLFQKDDLLHLIRLIRTDFNLEFKRDNSVELVRLPLDYVGPFSEVIDQNRTHTLGDLALTASVPRTLYLRSADRRGPDAWIPEIPADYDGVIQMDQPEYHVEIQLVLRKPERRRGGNRMSMTETYELAPKVLVPMNNEIRVQPREENYVCLNRPQIKLRDIVDKYRPADFPLIVRVMNWDEETTILKNHAVRPGQLLAVFAVTTIAKVALSAGDRHFILPLTHGGKFRQVDDNSKLTLDDFRHRPVTSYPVWIKYIDDGDYVNLDDDVLPNNCTLRVESLVDEPSLLVGRWTTDGATTSKTFQLPVRTRIDVSVDQTKAFFVAMNPGVSPHNDFAEEIVDRVYRKLVPPAVTSSSASFGRLFGEERTGGRSATDGEATTAVRPRCLNPNQALPRTPPGQLQSPLSPVYSDRPSSSCPSTPPSRPAGLANDVTPGARSSAISSSSSSTTQKVADYRKSAACVADLDAKTQQQPSGTRTRLMPRQLHRLERRPRTDSSSCQDMALYEVEHYTATSSDDDDDLDYEYPTCSF